MVEIPRFHPDPTLEAARAELERRENAQRRRRYIGMSSIGDPCSRKLWYGMFSKHDPKPISSTGLLAINDGHRGEDVIVALLQAVPGIHLDALDPETGGQIAVSDFDGKFKGHLDGMILGLRQAPKTWHVFESKVVNEKKFAKLRMLIQTHGEKQALREWDAIYYAQAVCYMHYIGWPRHYLVCATPGVRDMISVRTEENPVYAAELRAKAERILNARFPPAKLSERPDWHQCLFCQWHHVCHGDTP